MVEWEYVKPAKEKLWHWIDKENLKDREVSGRVKAREREIDWATCLSYQRDLETVGI